MMVHCFRECVRLVPLAVCLCATAQMVRADGEITWKYDLRDLAEGGQEAIITGYVGTDAVVSVPATVKGAQDTDAPVVAIGRSVFSPHRDEVTDVTLPATVADIGESAFDSCGKLESVNIPEAVTNIGPNAFYDCPSLKAVDVSHVASIGFRAFSWCTRLEQVELLPTMTDLGEQAFAHCTALKSFVVPSRLKVLPGGLLDGCASLESVILPDCLETIGDGALAGCAALKSITIPPTLKWFCNKSFDFDYGLEEVHIGDLAAWYAIRFDDNPLSRAGHLYLGERLVTELVIPSGVRDISCKAFAGVEDFTTLVLPEGLTNIQYQAFSQCRNIRDVTVPSTLQTVEVSAFVNVGQPMTVRIHDLESWCTIDFANYEATPFYQNNDGNRLICGGEEVFDLVVPSTVSAVKPCAFYNCKRLTSVTLHDGVTSIGPNAFANCHRMTNVTVGAGVESIGSGAFAWCNRIKSVTISNVDAWCSIDFAEPGSNPLKTDALPVLVLDGEVVQDVVTSVGISAYAFYNYSHLRSVKVISAEATVVGDSAFVNCNSLVFVELGTNVCVIGGRAFENCDSLSYVTIPNTVTNIVHPAFHRNTAMERVTVPPCVTQVAGTFDSVLGFPSAYAHIADLTLDEGYTVISSDYFDGCAALRTVTLPSTLEDIEEDAFSAERCPSLTTIYVPSDFGDERLELLKARLAGRPEVEIVVVGLVELPELMPFATPAEIRGALHGFVDPEVEKYVDDWDSYEAFRRWVSALKDENGEPVELDRVRESPYAWVSFALASPVMLTRRPEDTDLHVIDFALDEVDANWHDLKVALAGITVGSSARPDDLRIVFAVIGDATLDISAFEEKNVASEFDAPAEGRLMIRVAPANKSPRFFFKPTVRIGEAN